MTSKGRKRAYVALQNPNHFHLWQSHVEIEGYSVTYFDLIAAFEVPYH